MDFSDLLNLDVVGSAPKTRKRKLEEPQDTVDVEKGNHPVTGQPCIIFVHHTPYVTGKIYIEMQKTPKIVGNIMELYFK
jgi:hypothetical protein